MDTNDLLKKIDEATENLPEEVQSFVFGDEFQAVFEGYKNKYPDQEIFFGIKNKTLEYVLGILSVEELRDFIEKSTPDKQLSESFKKDIQEKIINEIILILETTIDTEDNKTPGQKNISSSQINTLSRLSQSFTAPSAIIPKKSVYTEAPSVASGAPTAPTLGGPKSLADALPLSGTPKASADPYRVDPNEE